MRWRGTHASEHLYEGGSEYVTQLNERREVLHSDVIQITEKEIEKGTVEVELAFQWSDGSESISATTSSETRMGGLICLGQELL